MNGTKKMGPTKHRSHAFWIPSNIQSPSCHLAECKTPLSSCPALKSCPDMELRTVLTVQKPKTATPIQRLFSRSSLLLSPLYNHVTSRLPRILCLSLSVFVP
ncbi:uncharacterized protein TNCV_1903361 [Trichonephila clavipes]|nr:uncharacterized protein TNCV_1903361 [Trichonephila clavipes]